MTDLEAIIKSFKERSVLVVGDVMLDYYIYGETTNRPNPEAPVPLLDQFDEKYILGGAANTANNISHLGAKVFLYSIVGKDNIGNSIIELASKNSIEPRILELDERISTRKLRIIGKPDTSTVKQQVVRVDQETREPLNYKQTKKFMDSFLLEDLEVAEVYMLVDYAKGIINKTVVDYIKEEAKKRSKLLLVQPKPVNKEIYYNSNLIIVNTKEARELTDYKLDVCIDDIGFNLVQNYKSNIIITRGKQGMDFYGYDKKNMKYVHKHVPTKPVEAFDETGAGDTVFATLGLALASGLEIEKSMYLANKAASIAIRKVGTYAVTNDELIKIIDNE